MRDSDVQRMIDGAERGIKIDMAAAMLDLNRRRVAEKAIVDMLLARGEFLDEDRYPTQDALTIIELWPFEDQKGWFIFIESLWAMKDFGWSEGVARHEYRADEKVYLYELSTAGWSGNESIIRAMEKNNFLWQMVWWSSRRGGHYTFQLDYEEDVG